MRKRFTFSQNGTAADRITVTNYDHENVIIDGQYTLPGGSVYYFLVMVSGDYVTLSNVDHQAFSRQSPGADRDYGAQAIGVRGEGSREAGMYARGTRNLFYWLLHDRQR